MSPIDGARIRSAIRAAEEGTSGRIGVHVTRDRVADALEHARESFARARLHEHPDRNAVLFTVAPKSRKFAVYGGAAVHGRLGDAFWQQLVDEMRPYFAGGRPTEGLESGIGRVGDALRAHFPALHG
ncbi:MAG: TPM domain-containing protein [Candidatus Eremiobacteraeota bacterium]|nr:TPM domain-containing protein [Candidatus Eremiobacteraeota bacterium]